MRYNEEQSVIHSRKSDGYAITTFLLSSAALTALAMGAYFLNPGLRGDIDRHDTSAEKNETRADDQLRERQANLLARDVRVLTSALEQYVDRGHLSEDSANVIAEAAEAFKEQASPEFLGSLWLSRANSYSDLEFTRQYKLQRELFTNFQNVVIREADTDSCSTNDSMIKHYFPSYDIETVACDWDGDRQSVILASFAENAAGIVKSYDWQEQAVFYKQDNALTTKDFDSLSGEHRADIADLKAALEAQFVKSAAHYRRYWERAMPEIKEDLARWTAPETQNNQMKAGL